MQPALPLSVDAAGDAHADHGREYGVALALSRHRRRPALRRVLWPLPWPAAARAALATGRPALPGG
jgi:hypothetical protein